MPERSKLAQLMLLSTRRESSNRTLSDMEAQMLWTIFALLMILWVLGVVSSYTLGGFVHLLLLLAIAAVLIRIIHNVLHNGPDRS